MKFVPASDFVLNKIRLQDLLAHKSIIDIISSFLLQKYTDGKIIDTNRIRLQDLL